MHSYTLFKLQEIKNVLHLVFHHLSQMFLRKHAFLCTLWGKMPIFVIGFIKLTLPALYPRGEEADAAELSCTTGIFPSVQNGCDFPSFIEDRSAVM